MRDVEMPQMGESIVEGTITKWLKKVGDRIQENEPLLEVSTDKVDSEVPAPTTGVVKEILAKEGETVEIHKVIARIDEEGDGDAPSKDQQKDKRPEKPAAEEKEEQQTEPEKTATKEAPQPREAPAAAASEGERVRSSPLVKRMAREMDVDLSEVEGSGQGGRVTKQDLEAHLEAREKAPAEAAAPTKAPTAAPSSVAAAATAAFNAFPAASDARFGDYYVEPLSTMRKRIAEHMVRSMHHTAPHVSMVHPIDCTAIYKAREAAKEKFLEQNDAKLTYMPFFLKASAAALKQHPMVNASLDGEDIVFHRDINIGVAVALDWGLLVPVIKNADNLSIVGLQKALNDLAGRARKKQLKPDELSQSTFSVSNYGSYGSVIATPAINQPNAALLGLGALHKAPVVVDDAIAVRWICYATLTIDHRLVDGALAAVFLEHVRKTIENWSESVL